MSDFILYNYFRSSASYRVRIALALKGIEYEYRAVHLVKDGGEQKREDYLELNAKAEVPTLVHRGRALAQSVAILLYLEDVQPKPALFPKDPFLKAQVMQACEIINSGIQPLGNLSVLNELEKRCGWDAAAKEDWTTHWMKIGLKAFESYIGKTAGTFCFGNEPTAADAFLVPQFYNALRFRVSVDAFPLATRIYKNCIERPEFIAASPERQPDTPAELQTSR